MFFVKTPGYLKRIFSSMIWDFAGSEKEIFLTFDDGPVPELTPFVLDELKKHQAEATFFCVGKNISRNPEIYDRILKEGHAVGNHTNTHKNGWETEDEEYFEEIRTCAALVDSKLFRPPYGRIKISQIEEVKKNYKIIMWDVLSGDWNHRISPEECLDNIIKNTEAGSILVMHDSVKARDNLYYTLPRMLDHFTDAGYKFKKISA